MDNIIDIEALDVSDVQTSNGVALTEEQMDSLTDWLSGRVDVVPPEVKSLSSNIEQKVNFSMCYVIASHMRRSMNMLDFLEQTEKILYDANTVASKDTDDILSICKEATKTLNQSLEFVRKFIVQNKESLKPKDEKVDQLQQTLMSLSPERIDTIMQAIQNGAI